MGDKIKAMYTSGISYTVCSVEILPIGLTAIRHEWLRDYQRDEVRDISYLVLTLFVLLTGGYNRKTHPTYPTGNIICSNILTAHACN